MDRAFLKKEKKAEMCLYLSFKNTEYEKMAHDSEASSHQKSSLKRSGKPLLFIVCVI